MNDSLVTQPLYRLAVIGSHPTQYAAPFYRYLALRGKMDLEVYYCCRWGAERYLDPGFGKVFQWDRALLEGYGSRWLKNYSPKPSTDHFFGLVNPGIIKELLKKKYDAVLIPGYALLSYLLTFVAAFLSRTPVMFRGETVLRRGRGGVKNFLKERSLRFIFRHTAAFLSIGSASREFYKHFGVPDDKIFFTPYSVDNDFFMTQCDGERRVRTQSKAELGIPAECAVILFCGKLIERKRPGDLLEAFRRLRYPAALVFVGDGKLLPVLKAKAETMKHIHFVGFKNQKELPRYYAMADVFVLASDEREVSPLVINEAMCARLPLVVSDAVPSARDLVEPPCNGFIFAKGNIEELALCLDRIIGDKDTASAMGEKSYRKVSEWSFESCERGLLKALEYVKK